MDGEGTALSSLAEPIELRLVDPEVNIAPVFTSEPAFILDENIAEVGTVEAVDGNAGDIVTYAIAPDVGDATLFTIDAGTGALSFLAAPDFEGEQNSFTLTVEAADGTDTTTQDITIDILDVAEPATAVLLTPVAFDENVPGAVVADVATDGDTPTVAADFVLGGTDAALFELVDTPDVGVQLKLIDTEAGDFEAETQPEVTVAFGDIVSEPFSPAPSDVDELATEVVLTPIAFDENVEGAVVATVEADDPDGAPVAADYALVGDDAALFQLIDGETGVELALAEGISLDFEAEIQPSVTVEYQGIQSALFTPAPSDVDEAASAVAITPVSVDENVAGAKVADVAVDDPDGAPLAGDLILGGDDAALFQLIDGENGVELLLAEGVSLDFEAPEQPSVTIEYQGIVSDAFSPAPNDVDELATEVVLTPVSVDENDAGAKLADVSVDDPDGAPLAADLSLSGEDAALFALVDGENGVELVLAEGIALDFEAAEQPSVVVVYQGIESAPFTPAPADLDEDATAVTIIGVTFDENIEGAKVAKVSVDDPDGAPLAAELVLGGDDAALFELIDGENGVELVLAEGVSLDFEAAEQPVVTVEYQGIVSAAFTAQPSDVDEPATEVLVTPVSVDENDAGAKLADVSVDDPDGA
ncbi:MAG: cadherin repeat domain-containing protein, partial [Pseudomonadota bacterium]